MKPIELLTRFRQKLAIENYFAQTIQSHTSALKNFLKFIRKYPDDQINDNIRNYLYYYSSKKNYSYSEMKQITTAIRYLFIKVPEQPVPTGLNVKMRKPVKLPVVLSKNEIMKLSLKQPDIIQ